VKYVGEVSPCVKDVIRTYVDQFLDPDHGGLEDSERSAAD